MPVLVSGRFFVTFLDEQVKKDNGKNKQREIVET